MSTRKEFLSQANHKNKHNLRDSVSTIDVYN